MDEQTPDNGWIAMMWRGLALLAAPYLWTPERADFVREKARG